MHCLPSSEKGKMAPLDVWKRQHCENNGFFRLKKGDFRRIIQNVKLYPKHRS